VRSEFSTVARYLVQAHVNVRTTNIERVRSLLVVVEWIAILVAAAVVMAGVLAIVAVVAAGASDRLRDGADAAQSALMACGFSVREQHLLATLASVVRAEVGAASVEVALAPPGWGGDGIVVTGSCLAPRRLGVRVAPGSGTAGRTLASGEIALAEPRLAMAVPIPGAERLLGVVLVVSPGPERLFGGREAREVKDLVDQTAQQIASPVGRTA
jgi:hypothetical protein